MAEKNKPCRSYFKEGQPTKEGVTQAFVRVVKRQEEGNLYHPLKKEV